MSEKKLEKKKNIKRNPLIRKSSQDQIETELSLGSHFYGIESTLSHKWSLKISRIYVRLWDQNENDETERIRHILWTKWWKIKITFSFRWSFIICVFVYIVDCIVSESVCASHTSQGVFSNWQKDRETKNYPHYSQRSRIRRATNHRANQKRLELLMQLSDRIKITFRFCFVWAQIERETENVRLLSVVPSCGDKQCDDATL